MRINDMGSELGDPAPPPASAPGTPVERWLTQEERQDIILREGFPTRWGRIIERLCALLTAQNDVLRCCRETSGQHLKECEEQRRRADALDPNCYWHQVVATHGKDYCHNCGSKMVPPTPPPAGAPEGTPVEPLTVAQVDSWTDSQLCENYRDSIHLFPFGTFLDELRWMFRIMAKADQTIRERDQLRCDLAAARERDNNAMKEITEFFTYINEKDMVDAVRLLQRIQGSIAKTMEGA